LTNDMSCIHIEINRLLVESRRLRRAPGRCNAATSGRSRAIGYAARRTLIDYSNCLVRDAVIVAHRKWCVVIVVVIEAGIAIVAVVAAPVISRMTIPTVVGVVVRSRRPTPIIPAPVVPVIPPVVPATPAVIIIITWRSKADINTGARIEIGVPTVWVIVLVAHIDRIVEVKPSVWAMKPANP